MALIVVFFLVCNLPTFCARNLYVQHGMHGRSGAPSACARGYATRRGRRGGRRVAATSDRPAPSGMLMWMGCAALMARCMVRKFACMCTHRSAHVFV